MAFNFNNIVFNELIATNSTNYHNPTELEMNDGVLPNTKLNSELVNSFLYKCSAAVKNIQENGAICYMPSKEYNPGNVVVCQVVFLDYMTTNVFRCKKKCKDIPPYSDIINNSDTGFIYFNESEINTEYWDRVYINSVTKNELLIEEFNKIGSETRDTDFKYVELFDSSVLTTEPNQKAVFRLSIKRDDAYISANINITIVNSKIKVNVLDLYCNKYEMDSTTSIFNPDSKFKDFALLGSFISIDQANNKVYLVFCPRAGSVTIQDKFIHVNLSQTSGRLRAKLIDAGDSGKAIEADIIKVPFVNTCSSEFNKSFELFDSFELLDFKERFKRGLILLDGNTAADPTIYSCINKYTSGNNFADCYDRYASVVRKQGYLIQNQVLQDKLDKLENIEAQYTGVPINYLRYSFYNNQLELDKGMFSIELCEKLGVSRFFTDNHGVINSCFASNTWRNNYAFAFAASRSNATYTDQLQDKFYMNSTKIYKYVYFI